MVPSRFQYIFTSDLKVAVRNLFFFLASYWFKSLGASMSQANGRVNGQVTAVRVVSARYHGCLILFKSLSDCFSFEDVCARKRSVFSLQKGFLYDILPLLLGFLTNAAFTRFLRQLFTRWSRSCPLRYCFVITTWNHEDSRHFCQSFCLHKSQGYVFVMAKCCVSSPALHNICLTIIVAGTI